jgi:hypothetical protein
MLQNGHNIFVLHKGRHWDQVSRKGRVIRMVEDKTCKVVLLYRSQCNGVKSYGL